MLAILDPELRHVSPSRKQSAALIGSLALISITVGAAAPAPRASAPVSESAVQQGSPNVELASSQKQPVVKGYPDSREIIGGSKTHQITQTQVQTVTQTRMSEVTHTVGDIITNALAKASSSISPAALQDALSKDDSKQGRKTSDERPALLAKVLATDTSAELRRIAAWGLAEYADTQVAVDALSTALRRDSDPRVREMAAWALAEGEHSSPAVQALSAALRGDASTDVRVTAAWALGNIGDRSSAEPLTAALADANVEVRKRAVWGSGQLRSQAGTAGADRDAERQGSGASQPHCVGALPDRRSYRDSRAPGGTQPRARTRSCRWITSALSPPSATSRSRP